MIASVRSDSAAGGRASRRTGCSTSGRGEGALGRVVTHADSRGLPSFAVAFGVCVLLEPLSSGMKPAGNAGVSALVEAAPTATAAFMR